MQTLHQVFRKLFRNSIRIGTLATFAATLLALYAASPAYAVTNISIGNGSNQADGSYINAQQIGASLAHASYTIQAEGSINIVDPTDVSTSVNGTPQYNLTLISPVCNIDNNINMAATGNLYLDCGTINLNARITSGGTTINPSRVVSTATQVNVLSNTASIQQAIDISSLTSTDNVHVSSGEYVGNLTIGHALTLTGNDGTLANGADPSAPTIIGDQPGGNVITVSSNNVKVDGLYLSGAVGTIPVSSVSGVFASGVDGLAVTHNTFDYFSGLSIATPGSTNVVSEMNETIIDPTSVTIGNSTQQINGTYLNCQKIADNLVFTSITVQATAQITIADNCDLSTSSSGTPQYTLSLITPTLFLNNNLNLGASGDLILTDNITNLNAHFTSGGHLINPSRVISTATQVNVLSNSADIQQAINITSVTSPSTVSVSPGQYDENLVINQPLTLSGVDGTNLTGADPSAPTINGTEFGDSVIDVLSNNVEIDGLHLNGQVNGSSIPSANGISFANDENVTASHNTFDGFSGPGVNTTNSFDVTLNANDFAVPTPTLFTGALQTHTSPFLTWNTSPGVASYDIYRNGTEIATSTNDFFIDSTAPQGSNTYYLVADSGIVPVGNNTTVSPPSNTATIIYDTTAPSISYTLSQTPNAAGWNNSPVTVTFNCSTSVTGVSVSSCTPPVTLSTDESSQTVNGTVTDSAGNSANITATVNLEQAAPVVSAPQLSSGTIVDGQTSDLTAPVIDGLSGVLDGEYYIGSDPGVGNGTPMDWDGANLTATLGSSLAPGTYQISVRAENVAGVWSGVETVQLVVNPVAPTNLTATSPTNKLPALSWTAASDAEYYNIYRNGVSIGTSNSASFTDNNAPQGTSSYYVTSVSAGGTESASSNTTTVNYETTPPTITYTLSASPNSNGWYNAPVTVTYHCTDYSGTGIAFCSSPQTLGDNGLDETSGVVGDNAGNTATSAEVIVQVETTPPTVGAPVVTSPITQGQTVTLSVPASEQVAGVTGGEYFIGTDPGVGNGTPMTYNGTDLIANLGSNLLPGSYTVSVRAEDRASNWSNVVTTTLTVNPVQVLVNLTAPSPTDQTPVLTWSSDSDAAYYNIYRNGTDIGTSNTASFNDTNAPTGNNSYYVTAVNAYGYESAPSNDVNVIYDTTAPTISYQLSQTPNSNGWFNSPVTVTFTCSSTVNGVTIASCTPPVTLSIDGANQQVTGTATDTAGNTSSTTASVSIDQTAPTLGSVSWSANPITVGGSSLLNVPTSDLLSGVVKGEYFIGTDPGVGNGTPMTYGAGSISAAIGSNLGVGTYSIGVRSEDAAGNWSAVTTTSLTINAQKAAAPTNLSATSPTNQAPSLTWNASAGALTYNVYRNSVKIGSSTTASYTDSTAPQGTFSYYVTAVNSGGESLPSNTASVLFDTTPPTITYNLSQAPNSAGWENSPVTVTFTCSDAVTTVSTCTAPVTVNTDGANQQVTGTATDAAGNTASVTATINLDQTLPTVSVPVLATNPIAAGQTTTLTDSTADNLSGVVGGEYFIGTTDPGVGNGTHMTLSPGILSATIGSGLASGTYQVNVRSEDAAGNWSVVSTTSLVVNPVSVLPAFTSGASAITSTGTALSFAVTASGTPTPVITESGTLPKGVTFAGGNGTATLSGTPTAGTNGTYTLTFTAANTAGHVAQTFMLTITSTTSAPKITSVASTTVKYGVAMTPFAVTASGNPAPTLSSNALPSGLKFTNNGNGTATISGTPNNGVNGVYTVTITAKNSVGSTTQTFTIYVDKAPTFNSVISNKLIAVVGSSYSFTTASTGYPVPTMTESGTLPKGLTFSTSNGNVTISGTPAAGITGTYTIKFTATNSFGSTTETFTLYVAQAPVITSASSSSAKVGTAFKFQITSTGFPTPDYFILGALPKGLTYNVETGVISGTPAAGSVGTYKLTIYAFNIVGITSQKFTLTVQ